MRKLLQRLLRKPIAWLADKLSSSPHHKDVFDSLSSLLQEIRDGKESSGLILDFDYTKDRFIVLSDQHKGTRNDVDDFKAAEKNYLAALQYYYDEHFQFINLGDCEELWKNTPIEVMKTNDASFAAEKQFLEKNQYFRIFGNHDLVWKFILQQNVFLKPVFGSRLKVYEGLVLRTKLGEKTFSIFLAHGHQGDKRNDGNTFSIWVVANIWTPIQRYLQISINTPATSFELTDKHNIMMHEWSSTQKDLVLISGHTHKPVFASMDHLDELTRQLEKARVANDAAGVAAAKEGIKKHAAEYAGKNSLRTDEKPSYFNSGCCCFSDGDITGIEIADGYIRLIKWQQKDEKSPSERLVLEQSLLSEVFGDLSGG